MKYHYFIGQKKSPFHLSVGAVLMNSKREVYCHHLRDVRGRADAYLLMRETVRPNDSLEGALKRGLREEFGVKAKTKSYLGAVVSSFTNWQGAKVEKTTLYFLCTPIGAPAKIKRMESHYGARSSREWKSVRFLIPQMKKQGRILKRTDFDESEVLKRV